jgi:hypothetical protein
LVRIESRETRLAIPPAGAEQGAFAAGKRLYLIENAEVFDGVKILGRRLDMRLNAASPVWAMGPSWRLSSGAHCRDRVCARSDTLIAKTQLLVQK